MMAYIISMIISIYMIYYYYGSNMDGASDVPLTYGHSESIGAASFQFQAGT